MAGRHGGRRPGAGNRPLPPEQRTRVISVTLSPDTIRRLEETAAVTGQTRSKIVNAAIQAYLGATPYARRT